VSLILDALRKLDREKDAREPGVVVVGSVPWGRPQRSSFPIALAGAAAGIVVLAAAGWWLLRPAPPRTTAPAPATAGPAPGAGAVESLPLHDPVPTPAAAEVAPPPRRAPLPEPRRATETSAASAPAANPPAPAEPLADAAAPAPPAAAPAAPDDLRLQAIAERDGHPVALINDRLVREGDSFDGVTVLRIGVAEVEIEVRGQRRVLRF
jgi:hypothetical protein